MTTWPFTRICMESASLTTQQRGAETRLPGALGKHSFHSNGDRCRMWPHDPLFMRACRGYPDLKCRASWLRVHVDISSVFSNDSVNGIESQARPLTDGF